MGLLTNMINKDLDLAHEEVLKVDRMYKEAKENRRKHDWEWLVRQLFYRGYHFAQYNKSTSTITFANRSGVRIPINLLWAHGRAVRNQVTAFRPKWEVLPFVTTESAEDNALYSNKVLDYIYEKAKIKRNIKELITQGLLYSVGIWQFDVGKDGRILIRSVDPYDLYVDSSIRSADINDPDFGANYIIQTVNRPLEAVKNDPRYEHTDELKGGDNRLASAEYKKFLLQVTHHQFQSQKAEFPTKEIRICHRRVYQKDGTFKIKITHTTDGLDLPLYVKETDETEYPWEIYQGDLSPLELYGESWAKQLIPINRVIDALEAHIFEYNHIFARGRFLVDKNSGVRLIVNQHGQIIEKNRGATVTSLPISPLPPSPETQLMRFRTYFEDISGAHDVTLGRIPTGVKSGIAIDQLRQADACVDTKTQTLTKEGWRNYDELGDVDQICVFDPDSKKLKWGNLNKVFVYDKQDADVYNFETRNISALATPDHSWMTVNSRGNWDKKQTQELKNDNYIPLIAEWDGLSDEKFFDDDFIRLAAWVITEGSYSKNNGQAITIYQSVEANWGNVEVIKNLFDRLGIDRSPFIDNRGCYQFVFAGNYAKQIRDLFPQKTLTTNFIEQLAKGQLEILIDTMIMGDGHVRESGRRCFINTQKETIDSLQMACIKAGISTSIGEYDDGDENHAAKYVLYLKGTTKISVGKLIDKGQMNPVKFTGKVWCPNTGVGFWLARRSGKVFITGNTNQDDLVDNLEDFLSRAGRKILKLVAQNWTTAKLVEVTGIGGKPEYFMAVGARGETAKAKKSKFKYGDRELPLAIIGEENEVQ